MVHIVVEPPKVVIPSGTVVASALAVELTLASHVGRIRPGTPLRPGAHGWEISRDDPTAFSAGGHVGGEKLHGWRLVLMDFGQPLFQTGFHYVMSDVQESGQPVFALDDAGPYTATSPTTILLDAGEARWARVLRSLCERVRGATDAGQEGREPPEPQAVRGPESAGLHEDPGGEDFE